MLSRRVAREMVGAGQPCRRHWGCAGRFEFVKLFVKLRFTGAGYAIKASATLGTGEQSEELLVVAVGVQWCCCITLLVISGVQVCVCARTVWRLKIAFRAVTFSSRSLFCVFLSGCLLAPSPRLCTTDARCIAPSGQSLPR